MSTADQTPDSGSRGAEPSAFPWGIPASSAPTPGAGGPAAPPGPAPDPARGPHQPTPPFPQHHPFDTPQGSQAPQYAQSPPNPQQAPPFQAVYVPTGTHSQPAPPMMQSPYGAPLVEGGYPAASGAPRPPRPADPRRRRTLVVAGAAVVAAAGVAAALALTGGSSPSRSTTKLAAQEAQGRSGQSGGDDPGLGGAPGADASGSAGAAAGANGGKPLNPSGGNSGGATASGTSAGNAPGPGPGGTTAAHPTTTAARTTPPPASWHLASPPSPDCTYMDLPPSSMPQIQNGATGNEVKELQCLLKKSMLNIPSLQIDGQWGSATQSAFTLFQKCNNTTTEHPPDGPPPYRTLQLDGQAGPQSWTDLYYWDNQDFNGDAYYCNGFRHY